MRLARRHLDFERRPVAIDDDVELAAVPAAGTAQRVIRGFLGVRLQTFFDAPAADREPRTDVPSMHHNSQSIWPAWSNRTCSTSKIAS